MQLLFWIMDGLAAGWLTREIMSGEGYDLWMDTLIGIGGAVAGGFIANSLAFLVHEKMIYTNLAAVVGAVILTVFARLDVRSLKESLQEELIAQPAGRRDL